MGGEAEIDGTGKSLHVLCTRSRHRGVLVGKLVTVLYSQIQWTLKQVGKKESICVGLSQSSCELVLNVSHCVVLKFKSWVGIFLMGCMYNFVESAFRSRRYFLC